MKYSVIIKCSLSDYNYVIKKLFQGNIEVINSYYNDKDYYFILYENDYKELLKIDYRKSIKFVRYNGILNIINFIKHYALYFFITISISIILFLSNYLIIFVRIHTSDINLKRVTRYYLMDNNIRSFSLMKDYKEIERIKASLLKKRDDIEWLEITKNGFKYDVYIIKRKKSNIKSDNDKCNYVAKKSGTISKIITRKGVLLVQENNYVNQGDILISGDIIYNDELKKSVCANGKIYGEVWYEVNISYPLTKQEWRHSKRKFYNFRFNIFNKKYILFKNKYNEYQMQKRIGNNNFGVDILSSSKKAVKVKNIEESKAINIILKKAVKSISIKTHNKSKIISQNILKKYVKNGTIYMKVLITTEEELGVVESY